MWNLRLDPIRALLKEEGGLPRIAIETGTCRGQGTRHLADHFERVITIELSETLHREAKEALLIEGYRNVEFLHGDSASLLPRVLRELPSTESVFLFLDAHWSGDQTVNWAEARWRGFNFDTAHLGPEGRVPTSEEQVPLLSEIRAIAEGCRGAAHLLIDDLKNIPEEGPGLRDHEFPGEDWSHLSREKLLEILRPRLQRVQEFSHPSQWFLSLNAL